MLYLLGSLYYIIPIGVILFFAISLSAYISAKSRNKRAPDTYSESQMKTRLVCLVVSSVMAGILAVVVVAFIILLFMAVAFM